MNDDVILQDVVLQHGSYILRRPDGSRVFVKASGSTRTGPIEVLREWHKREKICLRVLRGLAVPRLVRLSKRSLPSVCQAPGLTFIAESWEGEKVDYAGLSPTESLAAWVFVVEQLVAFRRERILYTDIKCANVLVQKKPLRVVVVDFGAARLHQPGRFLLRECGFTQGFEAPECRAGCVPTERSLVYPLGLLLPHILTGMTAASINDSRVGLGRVGRILGRIQAEPIGEVVKQALSDDPARRPKDYEQLLIRIRSCRLPPIVRSTWLELRRPYRRRLSALGLEGWK
jgi:serine/threonine protein kinase